jgi:Ser/Thr protein kinase RdoA (MazF antagonist)
VTGDSDVKAFDDLTEQGRLARLRRLALEALGHYDLEVRRVRLLAHDSNATFRVDTADGTRVIRVGIAGPVGHSAQTVASEMAWLDALARETDIAVPRPVPNRSGEFVTVARDPGVPEPRNCVVLTWLPGKLVDRVMSPSTMAGLGALAAGLHAHGATFSPGEGFTRRYDRVFPYSEDNVLFDTRHRDLMPPGRAAVFETARRHVGEAIAALAAAEPPRLIHGDLHRWNVMVHRDRLSPFDFEDMLWGWPIQDIAVTLYYEWGSEAFGDLAGAFRTGYETVSPWPERGAGEIATFIVGRTLVLANDVLAQPEWRHEAAPLIERGERRIRDVLGL